MKTSIVIGLLVVLSSACFPESSDYDDSSHAETSGIFISSTSSTNNIPTTSGFEGTSSSSFDETTSTSSSTGNTSLEFSSSTSFVSICGNNIIENGEQCDDGNDINTDNCLTNCLFNTCGDGIINLGVEECDDITETENCDNDCTKVICGDFVVNKSAGEECDEGDKWFGTNCYNTCKERDLLIFVTSGVYSPDLGGVKGADKLCTSIASNAGVPGKFKAWLWENFQGPYETFYHSGGIYKLLDGKKVAHGFEQLYSGTLDYGIDIDENTNKVVNSISVWTGIHPNEVGWSSPENLCNNWQSKSSAVMGGLSMAGGLHMGKSNWGLNWISCDAKERLFCVQQPWNEIPG